MISVQEYVEIAKSELDDMAQLYITQNEKDPENWPLENDLGGWGDQELAFRFS